MSTSRLMAQRFAIDLSSLALGIWETARLLLKKKTLDAGRQKLELIRKSLNDFKQHTTLSDSLRIHLDEEFRYEEFDNLLQKLSSSETKKIKETIPEIESLIKKTQGCLYESRTAKADIRRAI